MTDNVPYIVINNRIFHPRRVSFSDKGNNQLKSLSATINNPHLDKDKIQNANILFYLNHGSPDGVPLFRGRIVDIEPTATETTIRALDVRAVITGEESPKLDITDTDNYDGSTLAQMLFRLISDKINTNGQTIIGVDALKDTTPEIPMRGYRVNDTPIYSVVLDKIKESVDDTDPAAPLTWTVTVVEDGTQSNITFKKKKALSGIPDFILSPTEAEYSYRRRRPITSATVNGVSWSYGSTPKAFGRNHARPITDNTITSRAEAENRARQIVMESFDIVDEIDVVAHTGHYHDLGSVVWLDVDNEKIKGYHRLVGKRLDWSETGGLKLSLKLGRDNLLLSQYLKR